MKDKKTITQRLDIMKKMTLATAWVHLNLSKETLTKETTIT